MLETLQTLLPLLERRERLQLLALAVAVVLMGLLEMVGVASILPFMQIVADPQALERSAWLARIHTWAGNPDRSEFLFMAGIGLLGIIALNNLGNALTNGALFRFAWAQNHRLSLRLLRRYLTQPYAFFLDRNTAELSQTLLTEVNSVVSGVLVPLLQVAARSVSVVLLVALLALVDARLALVVALVFGGSYGLIYLVLRRNQYRRGGERFRQNTRRFSISREVLVGIKDVKSLRREAEFLRRFSEPSWRYSMDTAINQIVGRIPRYALETVAFGTVIVIILARLRGAGDFASLVPVLSVYVFAGYRLMPALNELFSSVVTMRFNLPALERLHAELTGPIDGAEQWSEAGAEPSIELHESIELQGLGFRYPDQRGFALRDIDLRIEAKQVIGFVGTTGSGKTTLVDLILGLLTPTDGALMVDGAPLDGSGRRAWRQRCGYVPQDVFLSDDTIAANIAFGLPEAKVDAAAVERAAQIAQLHDFVMSLPDGYGTAVGERGVRLSGGQRQRIGIARALYPDPDVLVLDEATSALDNATEAAVLDTIHALAHKKTLLVIAHRLTTVRACDMIYLIDNGTVAARGTFAELSERDERFRALAGGPA